MTNIEKLKKVVKKYLKKTVIYKFLSDEKTSKIGMLSSMSNDQLLSLMRHESHRIEKAIYNNILEEKYDIYHQKWEKLDEIYRILEEREYNLDEPTIIWSKQIYDNFHDLENGFIKKNSNIPAEFIPEACFSFVQFLSARRIVRVWNQKQPSISSLEKIALSMIDGAKWAPTSGNRQPWRFIILKTSEQKEMLRGIKEEHCINAPLLIYVGMDTRLYGALGEEERSIFIDAGAAIMSMCLVAHHCGLGVCWNHFADDLINSRESNKNTYSEFAQRLNIGEYIAPIAIIAIGVPEFIPPVPARMEIENLLIK
jgi:nitroreductase